MPGLTGLHRADLELGRIELGLERQQAALMQYRTDRRAQARQLLASEFLVDPRVPGVALDGVRPRDDHHRSRRVDNAPENLPGDGVLGKDDDLNVPGPAGREDHLDSLEDLVVIRLSDPPAQVAQSRFKLTRNDPRFRHKRICLAKFKEWVLQRRTSAQQRCRVIGHLDYSHASEPPDRGCHDSSGIERAAETDDRPE